VEQASHGSDGAAVRRSPLRFLPHLRGSSRATLGPDFVAALTVTALAVPQGLAFALVAGVPPEMGLAACALPAAVAALFGSSHYLITGPTNTNALVIGVAIVGPVVLAGGAVPVDAVLTTALLAGIGLALFGLLGLGRASRFLSDSVIAGFMSGAGVLIALRQIPAIAGLGSPAAPGSALVPQAWPLLAAAVASLAEIDARSVLLAAGVPVLILLLRRLSPRLPAALLALAGATALSWALGWMEGPDGLLPVGAVEAGWSSLALPGLVDPGPLAAPALAIALLATVQSMAAARTLADSRAARFDPDRELVSQGVANIVASVPTSGSLTRSALLRASGARSRLAALLSGLMMLAFLPWIAASLVQVPLAALAGLVILSGLELVDFTALRRAAMTRGDALVLVATLGATLWIDLVQAVYVGVFLSLALLVRRTSRLQIVEIVFAGGSRMREIPIDDVTGTTPAVLLHLEGDLNFAVAPELSSRIGEIAERGPRVIVLRLKRARYLDATVLDALREAAVDLRKRGGLLLLCGLTDDAWELLSRTELGRALGPEGLLRAGPRLFEGFERALARTRALLRPLGDSEIFREERPSVWSYEI
jgi:SulP family sulfate permease